MHYKYYKNIQTMFGLGLSYSNLSLSELALKKHNSNSTQILKMIVQVSPKHRIGFGLGQINLSKLHLYVFFRKILRYI